MVGVVELDERGVLGAQVVDAGEGFGAEERLVPDVVEVLDDTVAPWFAQRDEPWRDAEVEAGRDDRSEVLPGGLDPAAKVGVVVELGNDWEPDPGPDPSECLGDQWRAELGEDVVADQMRADIDQVQRVELGSTEEVPRADHVDLMQVAGPNSTRDRVGHVLGHVPGLTSTRLSNPGTRQDVFDRSCRRDRGHADPTKLPLDRERPVLRSRVRDQPRSRPENLVA